MDRYLLEAKAGLLRDRLHPTRRTTHMVIQQAEQDGGIRYLANLGSQNAVPRISEAYSSGTQTSFKPKEETEEKGISTTINKEALAEAKSNMIEEPENKPPFLLPSENTQLQEYMNYTKVRYGGGPAGRVEADKIKQDTELFNICLEEVKVLKKEYNEWIYSANHTYMQYVKFMDSIGNQAIKTILAFTTKNKILPEIYETVITHADSVVRGIAGRVGLDPKDKGEEIKKLMKSLFEGKPYWKRKYNSLIQKEINEIKEMIGEGGLDEIPEEAFKPKKPLPQGEGGLEEIPEEAFKPKKTKKSVKIKI